MNSHAFSRLAISIVAVLLGFTTFAQAGPPLICHPIEIGQAKSLPWVADEHSLPDLTVHEWGTFTAIAGKDGRAAEWLPLGVPRYPPTTDLPQFVEHINGVYF